jgi:hypothetical protein
MPNWLVDGVRECEPTLRTCGEILVCGFGLSSAAFVQPDGFCVMHQLRSTGRFEPMRNATLLSCKDLPPYSKRRGDLHTTDEFAAK